MVPPGACGAALAQVVQQRRQQQQVRSGDPARQLRGSRRRLDEVPVDRVAVEAVALRTAAHRGPLRQQRDEQPHPVERLEHRHGRAARGEQPDERLARLPRPGVRQRRALGEAPQRRRRDGQPVLRGGPGDPQREHRVGIRPGVAGEDHLAVLLDHVGREGAAPRAAPPAAAPGAGEDPAPGDVGGVRDAPPGVGDRGEQRVGVGEAQRLGDPSCSCSSSRSQARP